MDGKHELQLARGKPVYELAAGLLRHDEGSYRVCEAAYPLWPALRALAAFGEAAQRAYGQGLAAVGPAVSSLLTGVPQHLRLRPTPRSALR